MNQVKATTVIIAMAFLGLTVMACNDEKDNSQNVELSQNDVHVDGNTPNKSDISVILKNYMALKDALVIDDNEAAQRAGKIIMNAFKEFDISGFSKKEQEELKDIITDATEHAEHISESPIGHQREHFKILSQDVIDMEAITGTKIKLYQDFCPMYDGGSAWLSMEKEIKNPYFGDKMLTCGKIQKEIN